MWCDAFPVVLHVLQSIAWLAGLCLGAVSFWVAFWFYLGASGTWNARFYHLVCQGQLRQWFSSEGMAPRGGRLRA